MSITAAFLKHILPHEGWYAAANFQGAGVSHRWFGTTDELAAGLIGADQQGITVYHACASFTSKGARRQTSARAAKSFWLDIDVAPKSRYANAAEAFKDCERFRGAVGLPQPVYVASGSGVHAYWPLVSDLDPATWKRYAEGLKAACRAHALDAGPERTADIASILRPPGTHHRKGTPKLVECGPLVGPYDIGQFEGLLSYGQPIGNRSAPGKTPRLAAALADVFADEPRSGRLVADACGQLGRLRATGGRLVEPLWYACLGVLAFCEDGRECAHEWSSGYDGYTELETDTRLSRAGNLSGATTCERFHALDHKTCEACPHFGKIKSPISLGKQQNSQTNGQTNSTGTLNRFGEKVDAPEEKVKPINLPFGFEWGENNELLTTEGTHNGTARVLVSKHTIYLDAVQTGEARGEFNVIFRQHLPNRGWTDISLPSRIVFSSISTAEFADRGANIHEHTHFIKYVRGAIDLLHAQKQLSMRYDQFGWKDVDTSFLYGLDLYTAQGSTRVVGNDELMTRCQQEWVGPAKGGNLDGWKQTINALFAQGCEPQSVALLAAFAAPLMRFQERDEGGAIIHLVTRESGTGKSTALIGAASVWGRREGLGLTNDDTRVSKALTLGALGNLPVIFDEIAIRDPEAIRAFVINFTNGRDKMRATRQGEIRHTASTWQTLLISAANTSLVDALSTQNTPEAPSYRIMEFGLELPTELRHAQGDKLRKALRANSGHAGVVYLAWLVQPGNLAWTKQLLEKTTQDVWKHTRWPSEYRFWVRTVAAIAVAGVIVKELGLVDFSIDRIMAWLLKQLQGNTYTIAVREWAVPILTEFLHANMADRLVVHEAFVPGKRAVVHHEPKSKLVMRYELAGQRCIVALSAMRDYLVGRELSYNEFMRALEEKEIVTKRRMQATLSAGTDIPGGQTWCMQIDMSHAELQGVMPQIASTNVVPMGRKNAKGI